VCQALEHEYLRNLHFPEDEPCGPVIDRREFDFERISLSTEEFKEEILHEVELYHTQGGVGGNGAGGAESKLENGVAGLSMPDHK
jgi:hypothetical protein